MLAASKASEASGIMCMSATEMKMPHPKRIRNEVAVSLSTLEIKLGINIESPHT